MDATFYFKPGFRLNLLRLRSTSCYSDLSNVAKHFFQKNLLFLDKSAQLDLKAAHGWWLSVF